MKETEKNSVPKKRGPMDTKQPKLNAYLLLFSLLAIATVTMRSIASLLYLNDYGYYQGGLHTAASFIVLGGSLLLLSYALLHRGDEPKRASFGGALTYAPGAPLSLCLILLGVSFLRKTAETRLASLLLSLMGALAIAGALYFLFAVLYEFKVCDLRAVFAMICTLFLILYAGYLYFDSSLAINATTKLVDQMAYIAAAIFFLFETRISLGREHWPLYTATGFVAALLCAYSAIPSALVYFFDGRVISGSAEEIFTTLFLFAYILCRTVLSLFLKGERATPLMAALHEDAKKLSDAVAASGPLPFEPDYTAAKESTPTDAAEGKATADAEQAEAEAAAPEEEATVTDASDAEIAHAQEDTE